MENQIRDLINWVVVKKQEETQDVLNRIETQTAEELVGKLDALALAVGKLEVSSAKKKVTKKTKKKPKAKSKKSRKRL